MVTHPLFPLSAHVLPGGRMALRIFEQRYTRMVKEACASETGFVICMLNSQGDKERNEHIYPIGTYVSVVDFNLLDDGLLGVTVEGQRNVRITNIRTEHDGLRIGDCEMIPSWEFTATKELLYPMDKKLEEIFKRYPEVNSLYDKTDFDDPIWVINRWLELLPVDAQKKQEFLQENDCSKIVQYLSGLVE
ncbi:MAG: LON peptidase substrate-binding domain-containing protein [Glaciecola sp.]